MNNIVSIIAIIGVVLNIFKRPESYVIWTFTNAYWVWHNYSIGEYEQAYLFAAMFAASIFGAVKWYKESRKSGKDLKFEI